MVIILTNYHVHYCYGMHLGCRFLPMRLLKRLCGPLSIALQIEAKLLCSCLCLFGAIFGLHALGEKNSFSLECESKFYMQ
jgi:hypothetical protein